MLTRTMTGRALTFASIGASGLIVNQAVFSALDATSLGFAAAAVVATQASTSWLWVLTERLVRMHGRTGSPLKRYVRFAALDNALLLLRLPLLALLIGTAQLAHGLANFSTLLAVFIARLAVAGVPYRDVNADRASDIDAAPVPLDGPVRIMRSLAVRPAPMGPVTTRRPCYFPYKYDVAGVVTIGSEILLPELEYFRAQKLGRDLDVELRVRPVGRTGPRGRSLLTSTHGICHSVSYEEHLGRHASNFRVDFGVPVELTVAPLLARSPHVIYANIVEALLRYLMVSRGRVLLHAACVELTGNGVLLCARTDTATTGTILRLLRDQGARFLSGDMTIVEPYGEAFSYPKPLSISRHTLRAVDSNALSRVEWAKLRVQSRVHSKEGRDFGRRLAALNIPFMGVNALTQIAVPPPKYHADRLVECDVIESTMVSDLFIIERGPLNVEPVGASTALQELIDNADDAHEFPPLPYFAPTIEIDGMTYAELRERERELLRQTLTGIRVRRVVCDDFSWADRIPDLVAMATAQVIDLTARRAWTRSR